MGSNHERGRIEAADEPHVRNEPAEPAVLIWRLLPRRVGWFLPLLVLVVAILTTRSFKDVSIAMDVFWWCFLAVMTAMLWRLLVYPSLTATSEGLVLRNPLPVRPVEVPWEDIVSLTPEASGIQITAKTGHVATAVAVQKSRWDIYNKFQSRADGVCAFLLQVAREDPVDRGRLLQRMPTIKVQRSRRQKAWRWFFWSLGAAVVLLFVIARISTSSFVVH